MPNLSEFLEESARKYPDRDAVVLGDTRLTYARVNAAANQVANLLVERGIRPGDKVALTCPNLPYFTIVYFGILKAGAVVVPLNVLFKSREVAYHLADSDAKAYFCFEGTDELPMGSEGHRGFTETDTCEHFILITADPAAEPPIEGIDDARRRCRRPAADVRDRRDRRRRHRRDPLHVRNHRPAQGRRAAAPQHARQRACGHGAVRRRRRATPTPTCACCRCSTRSARASCQNGAFAFGGTVVMLPRFEAAGRARPDGQGEGDLLRGRSDHVLGPARRTRRLRRRQGAGGQHPDGSGGRVGVAGRGAQGLQEQVRGDDPGGLRAVGDLAGGQLLAVRAGATGRFDRGADPRGGDEADRRRTGTRSRTTRTRSARSPSRATTS